MVGEKGDTDLSITFFQERIIFDNRTQMNADNQDFKYFDGLV
ncbi:hypothetical protein C5S29_03360, partial [ANME-1 cluster archaeon GoMg3.2]|nr:hypothetical protein [ANME-1 cluster archaeon GoMg3.2]